MKDIPCTPGARRIRAWVAQGEHSRQDFKYAVSDVRKIARSISAFANRDGGRLLIGVRDNGTIAGVRNEEDAYVVEAAALTVCSPAVAVDFHAYSVDTAITVIAAEIQPAPILPVCVREADGTRRAYYRVADENIAAHPLMVAAWERRAQGTPLLLNHIHRQVLDHIRIAGSIAADTRTAAEALRMSRRTATAAITELAAAGALTFIHTPAGFSITIPTDSI